MLEAAKRRYVTIGRNYKDAAQRFGRGAIEMLNANDEDCAFQVVL